MKRFSLIAHLGLDDKDAVQPLQTDSIVHRINFLDSDAKLSFGIGEALHQLASFGLRASEIAIDLFLLAALVQAGDTRVSRSTNSQDGWTREIDLYIPVSSIRDWRNQKQSLEKLLNFLTGDRWRIFFRVRPSPHTTLSVTPKSLVNHNATEISLLSGGLDSLIGAINLLSAGKCPLFVSHYWDTETARAQTELIGELEKHFPNAEFKNLRVRLGFDKRHLNTSETESTQRGRSFVFLALAILAASAFDRRMNVNIPENGFIALNVPLDLLRLGPLSTRTAHPHFLAGMQQVTNEIGLSVSLQNPYRTLTKGEMVSQCADIEFLRQIVGTSMSCSSPSKARYQRMSPRHCGYCVPCLIRRASLKDGLGVEDPTIYMVENLQNRTHATDRTEGEHIRSFQLMSDRIKKSPGLAKVLVHKPGPLIHAPDSASVYADMFLRGILEVDALLEGVVAEPHK